MNNTLQAYFQQQYQGQESFLQNVIFPIFGEENFDDGYSLPLLDHYPELCPLAKATGISSILHIGTIDVDFNPISIFDITVSSHVLLHRNRVGIQQIIRRIMTTYSSAFMLFHYEDAAQWDWRFTFCSKASNDELTDNKRYTFMLGPGQSCRTVAENFTKLLDKQGAVELADIQQAFDVEALSEEFFGKYKQHYEAFVQYITGKRFVKTGGKWLEKVEHEPHEQMYEAFGRNDKLVRDYVKKLLGRIVFLHFLQKKGWLGVPKGKRWGEGDQQFMRHLFTYATPEQQADFLDLVLEPLFDRGLDTDRAADRDLFDTHVPLPAGSIVKVPYLNGGLFERDALDEVTTRFPAEYFDALLQFLSQYNFTIDENDPNDAQVGVDPEMLGRIFENLLEDNKDKGAYYTPKEIVRYMCRQSLIAYLLTDLPADADPQAIRQFVSTYDVDTLGGRQSPLAAHIDERLRTVRICDPAIGSGAFPMGLLKELFLCRGAIEDFDNAAAIKRHIIQHNIYGVDIERGAVDIARLRFWLSLVVDEDKPHTLPNLDFKIMQGNSLLEQYQGVDLSRIAKDSLQLAAETQTLQLFDPILNDQRRKLRDLLSKYYNTTRHSDKHDLLSSINNCIHQQLNAYEPNLDLSDIDLQGNPHFFLWHTWFADVLSPTQGAGGFDILIGNPPYIQLQNNGGELAKRYERCGFQSFARTGDIYCLFYELGQHLLRPGGHLCYITSNKWMRAGYGENLRRFFVEHTNPKLLIDFAGIKIFDNATVDTNILLYAKEPNQFHTNCAVMKDKNGLFNLSDYVHRQIVPTSFKCAESWVILSPIEESIKRKIEAVGTPLKDWDININYGIKTGYNDAFIITTDKRNEILDNCETQDERQRTEELIRPILRGRDIKRYSYDWAGLWLIYIPWHFPYHLDEGIQGASQKAEQAFHEQYPSVYAHMLQYKKPLTERNKAETGIRYEWYAMQRWGAKYWEDFFVPKIVFQEIVQSSQFFYDDSTHYLCNDTCRIIVGGNLPFLLGIFNSRLFFYAVKKFYGGGVLGEKGIRMKHTFFGNFPCLPLIEEVGRIAQELCNHFSEELANQLDNAIYSAYALTEEEIKEIQREAL